MLWLALLLVVVVPLAVLLWAVPRRVYRLAWGNSRTARGTRHPRRSCREARHFLSFVADLLLAPLFVFAMSAGVLMAVHEFVMPIPMIADLAAMFSPDMAAWDARMETGKLGDVGVTYLEWRLQQGFSRASSDFWRAFLRQHWFILAAGAALLAAFQYWFWTRYFAHTVATYYLDLRKRRARYARRDMKRAARASSAPPPPGAPRPSGGVASVEGMRRARPTHQSGRRSPRSES